MAVYRFRVVFEDFEEVCREIEIKSTQNFEEFHTVILNSIDFDTTHNASFFIADDLWHKGEEIALRPAENDRKPQSDIVKRQMSKCKIALLIDDPHQKFVYIYDPKSAWTFLVELLKIVPDDAKAIYPKCVKRVGDAPKQYKKSSEIPVVLEEDEFEDEPSVDDDAYVNAHSTDEIAELEGEEGEEELVETPEEAAEEEDEFGSSELEDHIEGGFEED